jgi:hypothetical protein
MAPTMNLPQHLELTVGEGDGLPVSYAATASNGSPVVCTPASGSTFPIGDTDVHCSVTWPGGTVEGSFAVSVLSSPQASSDPIGRTVAVGNKTYTVVASRTRNGVAGYLELSAHRPRGRRRRRSRCTRANRWYRTVKMNSLR